MRYLLLTLFVAMLVGCGDGFFVAKVKQYYFEVKPATRENHSTFSKLFIKFNNRCNAPYLNLVRGGELSVNEISTITVTSGLLRRDGKLGWGRWLKTAKLNSRRGFLNQPHKVRKDIYTMELEFDREYLRKHARSDDDEQRQQWRTLFLHELGHGFQMGHDPDRHAVMYSEINSGYKDFDAFYEKAYGFLRN